MAAFRGSNVSRRKKRENAHIAASRRKANPKKHSSDSTPHLAVPGKETSQEQRLLVVFLWRAILWMDDGLQQTLRERGLFSMSRTQSMLFGNLSLGENRPSRLARLVGISPQAMSLVIGDLVKAGLIYVGRDKNDGRARVVMFTGPGEHYLSIVKPIFHQLEKQLEARFGRPLIDVMRMVLEEDWGPALPIPADS